MSVGMRLGVAFLSPIVLAIILWYLTDPLSHSLDLAAAAAANQAPANESAALNRLADSAAPKIAETAETLQWITRIVIMLGLVVIGFLVPRNASIRVIVDFLLAALAGFALAKLATGFSAVSWHSFVFFLIAGTAGALYITVIRSRRAILGAEKRH